MKDGKPSLSERWPALRPAKGVGELLDTSLVVVAVVLVGMTTLVVEETSAAEVAENTVPVGTARMDLVATEAIERWRKLRRFRRSQRSTLRCWARGRGNRRLRTRAEPHPRARRPAPSALEAETLPDYEAGSLRGGSGGRGAGFSDCRATRLRRRGDPAGTGSHRSQETCERSPACRWPGRAATRRLVLGNTQRTRRTTRALRVRRTV